MENQKIKLTKKSDMDEGWRKLAQDMKKQRGATLSGKPPKIGSYSSPRAGKPQKADAYGMNFPDTWGVKKQRPLMSDQKLSPPREEEQEEELQWSGEEWENWAFQIYENYPDMKQYLPDWFVEEVENETK